MAKDILLGELAFGARRVGRPALALRFRDACKRDVKSAQISVESWEFEAATATGDRLCGVVSG